LPQSPSIDEQRAFERQRVTALAYVELGECNGGIILDIGEGGIHVRAAVPLVVDEIPSLRFRLPLREDWIETSGQVAWMDESRTVAGIEFVDLPDEAAEQIRDWIASAASAEAPPGQLSAVRERTERLLAALPHAPAGPPGAIGRKLAALPAGEQVAPAARAVAAPVLFSPTAIRIEQPYQVSASRSGTSGLAAGAGTGPRRPSWVAFAVSVGLAALLSFAAAWFLSGRSGMNRMVAMVQDLAGHRNAPETSAQPSLTTSAPQGGPQVPGPAAPTVPTQEPARQPTSVSPPPAGAASSSAPLPGNSSARQGGQSTPGTAKTSARVTTAGGAAFPNGVPASGATEPSVRPVEIPPLQAAQQAGAAPSQSVEIPPAAAAPPPQPVEIVRGTVTVSASPYPSIRITPEMKERAAKEGTALQIGQLTSRVEPGYPNDAQQQRIEGTVMLRARIGRDGTVQSIDVIGGPPLLVPAAMDAVRQWRYNQTLFGGQPVEAEHNITIVFRLTKQQLQPQTN
jgi:TonB family protein